MYDVIIIGAGVVGSATARELSRNKVKACVIDREADVCSGTSKANSGIVHAGYDAVPGSLKAKLNVEGNLAMEALSKELDFHYKNTGSFVVCNDENNMDKLKELYDKGIANGVPGLEIITDKERIHEMEPNLTENAVAVLYAPSAGIVDPFTLNVALAENAYTNGIEFRLNTEVTDVYPEGDCWVVKAGDEEIRTKTVVNAAGVYADRFHNMVSDRKINIVPRKGEYYLLDKNAGNHVNRTIFMLPNEFGKGVLVTQTVDGNLLVGPTAYDIENKEGVDITQRGLDEVREKSALTVNRVPLNQVITTFAGLRAHEDDGKFIIGEVEDAPGFFDCAGIESPGLTSCHAIGKMVAGLLKEKLNLEPNPEFNGTRKGITKIGELTREEYSNLIKEKPAYGNIICRCETISEGEIIEAINRPLGATTLDGIKRRVRAGAGRCQGGFCSTKVMEIISRETGQDIQEVSKKGKGSEILMGITK